MNYNFKRALGFAFLLYISTFVVGLAAGIFTGQDMSSMENISESFWYIGMASAVILSALFTLWYFRDRAIVPSLWSGAYFGLTAVGLGIILDVILFTIGNSTGEAVSVWEYYADYRFWVIVVLVIGTAKAVGWWKEGKNS